MSDRSERLTRRQQRLVEKTAKRDKVVTTICNLSLKHIAPMTDNQVHAFNAYDDGKNLCMIGSAGTGKSFVALYHALRDVLDKSTPYRKVVIVRTAQPSKQIGFLPGSATEKLAVYEAPYRGIFAELFGRGDAYEVCKQKGLVEFTSTSFLRGTTIDEAVIIVDEFQNMAFNESFTVFSRLGENSRLVVCGDTRQDDLTSTRFNEKSGITPMLDIFKRMDSVEIIKYTVDDIVRSGFVKELILAYEESGVDPDEYR